LAKSIAVLHHDEEIKAYLRTKDPATNKIMSDGTEDWIKTFQEQGIQEKFHSQAENPDCKALADDFVLKRNEGLDDKIRKYYVDVKSSVLGEVAAHRDCHASNWILPRMIRLDQFLSTMKRLELSLRESIWVFSSSLVAGKTYGTKSRGEPS